MLCNPTAPGSLAAVTAVVCMLFPAGPAPALDGGASGVTAAGPQCCVAAPVSGPIGSDLRSRAIGTVMGGPAYVRLAQSGESAPTPDSGSEEASEAASDRQPPKALAEDASEEEVEPFRGSAEPAGPDLTAEQERELISRGWD